MPQRTLLSLADSDRPLVFLEVIPPVNAMRALAEHMSQKDGMRLGEVWGSMVIS